ncbi:PDZ domain-containing protein [Amycolatopsis sp. NPDC051071]|uniref:PDZ domain-containing protein n=1 Tax=Amycolatopsis sp. NPDC051071 TaxID=3154637 RepID=UPI00342F07E3
MKSRIRRSVTPLAITLCCGAALMVSSAQAAPSSPVGAAAPLRAAAVAQETCYADSDPGEVADCPIPQLGITKTLSNGQMKSREVPPGAIARELEANGPAAEAGIGQGDRIISAAGTEIKKADDLIAVLAPLPEGENVTFKFVSEGTTESKTIDIALRALPPKKCEESEDEDGNSCAIPRLGITDSETAYSSNIDVTGIGTKIGALDVDGAAAKAGIKDGNCIHAITTKSKPAGDRDGTDLNDPDALNKELADYESGTVVKLYVREAACSGKISWLSVTLP